MFLAWQESAEDRSCSAVQTAPSLIPNCPPDIEDQVCSWISWWCNMLGFCDAVFYPKCSL